MLMIIVGYDKWCVLLFNQVWIIITYTNVADTLFRVGSRCIIQSSFVADALFRVVLRMFSVTVHISY